MMAAAVSSRPAHTLAAACSSRWWRVTSTAPVAWTWNAGVPVSPARRHGEGQMVQGARPALFAGRYLGLAASWVAGRSSSGGEIRIVNRREHLRLIGRGRVINLAAA
jgi:hypothetical protein